MKRFLAAVLMLVVISLALPANAAEHDGKWWASHTTLEKAIYVNGLLDGITTGNARALKPRPGNDIIPDINPRQALDGIEKFYKDFRNRNIPVSGAMMVVLFQIEGHSDADLERLLQDFRRNFAKSSR